jgi:polyhydroxyalkanoate synthesis regulator phasin
MEIKNKIERLELAVLWLAENCCEMSDNLNKLTKVGKDADSITKEEWIKLAFLFADKRLEKEGWKIMYTNKINEKEKQIDALRDEVQKLKEKRWMEEEYPKAKKLEGTYWKYRDSYSCPDNTENFWWLYQRIIKVLDEHIMLVQEISVDKDGLLTATANRTFYRRKNRDGWIKITRKEWKKVINRAYKLLEKLEDK